MECKRPCLPFGMLVTQRPIPFHKAGFARDPRGQAAVGRVVPRLRDVSRPGCGRLPCWVSIRHFARPLTA